MKVIRTKRKTIALIIQPDGSLLVRAPLRYPQREIDRLVAEKAEWIRSKQELVERQAAQISGHRYSSGETFLYIGVEYPLQVVRFAKPQAKLELRAGQFRLPEACLTQAEASFEAWYRAQARQVLAERVQLLAHKHGLKPGRIAINGARTRWGSCGSSGSLNFTWRLVMAPLDVIDYVVAHELAHLKERNHSRRFWAELERLLPGYHPAHEWLKANGRKLFL